MDFDEIDSRPSNTGNSLPAPTVAPNRQPSPQPMKGAHPAGLQEPLQPGQPIKRVDTLTSDVDEFVDAAP